MFEGQLLIDKGDTSPYTVFSPWFRRMGDNAVFNIEVIEETLIAAGGTFDIKVYTKRHADAGDGVDVTTAPAWQPGGSGFTAHTQTGDMKDIVRFAFTMPGSDAGAWVLFRMLRPQWYNAV